MRSNEWMTTTTTKIKQTAKAFHLQVNSHSTICGIREIMFISVVVVATELEFYTVLNTRSTE